MTTLVGLDVGTTGVKVVAISPEFVFVDVGPDARIVGDRFGPSDGR